MKTTPAVALLAAVVSMSFPSLARAASCEELLNLTLTNAKVTTAQTVAAGRFAPPGAPPAAAAAQMYASLLAFC